MFRQSRDSVLIVTNGKCTERQYFEALRPEPWVKATLRVMVRCVAPQVLVAEAKALRDANEYDHVWVVCDVDEFDVSLAIEDALASNVGLALSNPVLKCG
jgi:RloB-like protein